MITSGPFFTATLSVAISAGAALAATDGAPDPSGPAVARVADIVAAAFERVPGPGTGGAALYPDATSTWADHSLSLPTVDFDGRTYRMWFVGIHMTQQPGIPYGMAERVGLATSSDGIRWTVANDGKPVLDFGPGGAFDDAGIAHPFVLRVGGTFMMWYGGIDGRAGRDVGVGPAHVRIERIGLATSPDGIHWERANGGRPVLDIGAPGAIDAVQATGCHVIRRGGAFVMWYGAYDGTHTIGVATSPDGVHWEKRNGGRPVTGLTGSKQLGPSVHFDGSRYLMLHNSTMRTPNGGSLWTLFAATSPDGLHWVPAAGGRPVLGPAPPGNFGSADGVVGNNHAVHPTKMIVVGNRVRLWYGAEGGTPPPGQRYAPSAIGLMEARIGE